jgi:hypothetical protein
MKPWKTLHLEINGAMIDRDLAHPRLRLEMQPMGTQLEEGSQSRRLVITVESDAHADEDNATVLEEDGIAALAAFLKLRP